MQHAQRWITTVVLAPLVLWILIKGTPMLVAALVSVVAVLAIKEYLHIIFSRDNSGTPWIITAISFFTGIFLVIGAAFESWPAMFLALSLNFILLSVFVLFRFSVNVHIFDTIAKQTLGILYIPLSLSLLLFVRNMENGILWIIWLLIVCFMNDTGAFYTGTFLGKHKLAPGISPKKTMEGSAGGVAASMTAGFVFSLIFFGSPVLALISLPCSFLIAVAGQVGDLFESALKRASNVKDSGRILPGHGGMLDRIDGLLFAIPVLYGYLLAAIK
ncbi:MAG: phosphatidate cytidylyltransferase [Desulfobacteraceae bacterium]|nr:phosphatidate cytidylyltransferase [Desulfobacteraceae bacterium]